MAEIAVIIVNYGTADLAIDAAQSVVDHSHGGREVSVHLLDNASPGEDAAAFARAHAERGWGEQVVLWPEPENHGFGRGNNVVIHALMAREDAPRYIFLLNPDARLDNEALDLMAGFLDSYPEVSAVGAGIASPDGHPLTAAFRFPSAASEFVQAVSFGPLSRLCASCLVPLPPERAAGPVDWVAGAAVMMRMDTLRQIGAFDPDFFLYYEEVELMHRIQASGAQIWYLPEARVVHAEGAATQVKSNVPERRARPAYWYDSWRFYYLKTRGRGGAIWVGLCWMAGAALNAPLAALRRKQPRAPLHFFRDFPRRVMGPLLCACGGRK